MDKNILKLFPAKAFKLLSVKESLLVGSKVTKSVLDKNSYNKSFDQRLSTWKWSDIKLSKTDFTEINNVSSEDDGKKILKIYFSQLFENGLFVHLDFRSHYFNSGSPFCWRPSALHYSFTPNFLKGIQLLYAGFYLERPQDFEKGLTLLGMLQASMSENTKNELKDIFYKNFVEAKSEPILFSLSKLQNSFSEIFSFFLENDIPFNTEFAVFGISLVTLYLTLQEIPHALNVNEIFLEVYHAYLPIDEVKK